MWTYVKPKITYSPLLQKSSSSCSAIHGRHMATSLFQTASSSHTSLASFFWIKEITQTCRVQAPLPFRMCVSQLGKCCSPQNTIVRLRCPVHTSSNIRAQQWPLDVFQFSTLTHNICTFIRLSVKICYLKKQAYLLVGWAVNGQYFFNFLSLMVLSATRQLPNHKLS